MLNPSQLNSHSGTETNHLELLVVVRVVPKNRVYQRVWAMLTLLIPMVRMLTVLILTYKYHQVIALTLRGLDPVVIISCGFSVAEQIALLFLLGNRLVKGVSGSRWETTDWLAHASVQPVCEEE